MKLYVSNENGDWWTINTASAAGGNYLFIISEEDLARAVTLENEEDAGADLSSLDGLAGVIISNGKSVKVDLLEGIK